MFKNFSFVPFPLPRQRKDRFRESKSFPQNKSYLYLTIYSKDGRFSGLFLGSSVLNVACSTYCETELAGA